MVIVNNPIIMYKYFEFVLPDYPPSKILMFGKTRDKKSVQTVRNIVETTIAIW